MPSAAGRWRLTALLLRWRLPRESRGNAFVEYVILVGVVALLAIHAFSVFGTGTSTVVREQGADVAKMGF
jgi:Flp pilus assembly pilin Flp